MKTAQDTCALNTPGDLPNPGIIPMSPATPALAGGFFTTSTTWEAPRIIEGIETQNEFRKFNQQFQENDFISFNNNLYYLGIL